MSLLAAANLTETLDLTITCDSPAAQREIYTRLLDLTPENFAFLPPTWSVKLGFICVFGLILLLGLLFNILIIVWIIRGKPKRTSTDIYVVSLCITDLMSACTTMPLDIALLTVDFNWYAFPESHSPTLCKASAYFQTASQCISQLTLIPIAVDRYIAVCHPLFHYKIKDRRQTISLISTAAVWTIGLVVSIADAVAVQLTPTTGKDLKYVPDAEYYNQHNLLILGARRINSTCLDVNIYQACVFDSDLSAGYDTFLFVVMYIVPQLLLAFCYTAICFRLWIRPAVGEASPLDRQAAQKKKSNKRITVVMLAIVITFGVLWLPYWCQLMYVNHTQALLKRPISFDVWPVSFTAIARFCIITSPIIYIILDRAFRNRVRTEVRALVECIKPNLSESSRADIQQHTSSHHTADTHKPTGDTTELQRILSSANNRVR